MRIPEAALERIERVLDVLAQISMVDLPDLVEETTTLEDLRRYSEFAQAIKVHSDHLATQVLLAGLSRLPG